MAEAGVVARGFHCLEVIGDRRRIELEHRGPRLADRLVAPQHLQRALGQLAHRELHVQRRRLEQPHLQRP